MMMLIERFSRNVSYPVLENNYIIVTSSNFYVFNETYLNPRILPTVAAISMDIRLFHPAFSTRDLLDNPKSLRFKLRGLVNFTDSCRSTSYIVSLWKDEVGVSKRR